MRRFANLYLFLFLVDAGLSLIDELLVAFEMPIPAFTSLRLLVAYTVIALSMLLFACLGIDRRLPKRLFLPLTLYISWCTVALWPLSGVLPRELLPLLASVGQCLVVACVLVLMRGRLFLPEGTFQGEMFSLGNTLGFTAVNLLLLPPALVFGGLAVTSYYLEEQTAGFLRISPIGIYMSERSYRLDAKEVRLAGMMHIGKPEYYEDLARSLPAKGAIILVEGVSDQDGLLEHHFNYSELASVMGLSSQETLRIDGNPVDLQHLDERVVRRANRPDIARADIDVNQFEPLTIEFLNILGRSLFSQQPLTERFAVYNDWAGQHLTPEGMAGILADILDKRNAAVIAGMLRSLALYETIIIPWGAMHMPAIERAVLEQGFAPTTRLERLSLDFRTLPYAELWQKWSTRATAAPKPLPSS